MGKLENLDDVKKDMSLEQKVEEVNILFLDCSSTCTGYAVMRINFEKKTCSLTSCGALWLNNRNWRDQERYSYMFHALSGYFWIVEKVDYVVAEQYSINPSKMIGVQVLPELMGVIKAASEENGVKCSTILPQTWRSQLGIKPVVTTSKGGNSKKDYKSPTKDKVLEYFNIPETSISNITGKERATPSDLYDAIAIALGWTKKYGITTLVPSEFSFNAHVGIMEQYIDR